MTDLLYVDSSALVKLIRDEPESPALRASVGRGTRIVSSRLAEVEIVRASRLAPSSAETALRADEVLSGCGLVSIDGGVLARARELVSPRLRTLDAIHLATALELRVRHLVTYDHRLIEAASEAGLRVLHPGLAA